MKGMFGFLKHLLLCGIVALCFASCGTRETSENAGEDIREEEVVDELSAPLGSLKDELISGMLALNELSAELSSISTDDYSQSTSVNAIVTGDIENATCFDAIACFSFDCNRFADYSSLKYGVIWKTEEEYNIADQILKVGNSDSWHKTVSRIKDKGNKQKHELTCLEPNTTYFYRAYLEVGWDVYYGEIKSFTTLNQSLKNGVSDVYSGEIKLFTTKKLHLPLSGFVDLGLSVKWAACNLGANAPEEFGDYYAWGKTSTKDEYTEDNLQWYRVGYEYLQSQGVIDENWNLTATYDAATQALGGKCRMPTKTEVTELKEKCRWEWTSLDGVDGYQVIGSNGNSIFLPAAGYRSGSSSYAAGTKGYYWSSTAYDDRYRAYYLYFYSGDYGWNGYSRDNGLSVRPVMDK